MPQTESSSPWSKTIETVLDELGTDAEKGLQQSDAERIKNEIGANKLAEQKEKSLLMILLDQLKSPVVYLLAIAAVFSLIMGDIPEATAIAVVLLVNAGIGFGMERQANKSMKALKSMDIIEASVRRDGEEKVINAEELVPGDVLLLREGDIVPADIRLISQAELQVNESALTGESVPVQKSTEPLDEDTSVANRVNMAFKGSGVSRGKAEGVVTATGMKTQIGNVSSLVSSADEQNIPLNRRLASLSRTLIWVILVLAGGLVIFGLIGGKDFYQIVQTSIAWTIAAIPEGLPIVASIALAKGMLRLAESNVIVKQLAAVETLGETNVILTDKTGTLTENSLKVDTLYLNADKKSVRSENTDSVSKYGFDKKVFNLYYKISIFCNDAKYNSEDPEKSTGDPLEVALLHFASEYDSEKFSQLRGLKPVAEDPFDTESKRMGAVHKQGKQYFMSAKGAATAIMEVCSRVYENGEEQALQEEHKEKWLKRNDELANEGLRTLALAYRKSEQKPEGSDEGEFMQDMVFLGLVGFVDPPKKEVIDAIDTCKKAGIEVAMVTGDHPGTALNIAHKVHISSNEDAAVLTGKELENKKEDVEAVAHTSIFARVDPEQKLDIVTDYQEKNLITGMTGDGVNDAPALKKADIGIAMGKRGTQVAKEVADMVLKDDSFPSIVEAIREGRIIFGNIRKFVAYQLSYHFSEILVIAAAVLFLYDLPLLPLQLLFLNILLDVFPALALGVGRGRPGIMKEPPKDPEEPIIPTKGWLIIGMIGAVIGICSAGAYFYAHFEWGLSLEQCNDIAFFSLSAAQLLNVFNMRDTDENLFVNQVTKNKYVWFALVFCVFCLALAYFIPGLKEILSLETLSLRSWLLVLIAGFTSFAVVQGLKQILKV